MKTPIKFTHGMGISKRGILGHLAVIEISGQMVLSESKNIFSKLQCTDFYDDVRMEGLPTHLYPVMMEVNPESVAGFAQAMLSVLLTQNNWQFDCRLFQCSSLTQLGKARLHFNSAKTSLLF